jgi:hypothetical protein
MTKNKITSELVSWGIYSSWKPGEKELPEIKKFTRTIPARIGIEFGYVLKIRKGRGKRLSYRIEHPPFPDADGNPSPPFEGDVLIKSNDWDFFLGDTIWEPVGNKTGTWRLQVKLDGAILADESFHIVDDEVQSEE